MRILHINNVANVALTLVRDLRARGIEADLIEPSTGGAHVSLVLRIMRAFGRLFEVALLVFRIRRSSYNVIHIHYGYYGLIGWLSGRPYILHCHGTDVRRNLYRHPFKFPTVFALKKANKVLFSTPDLGEHVRKVRPDAIFVPNPIDTKMFTGTLAQDNINLQSSERGDIVPKVLVLSRLEPVKGTKLAIDALRSAKNASTFRILAISWGSEANSYTHDANIELLEKVHYTEMPALMAGADICIGQLGLGILSMTELEAMCLGKPVVMYFKYSEVYSEAPPIVNVSPDLNEIRNAVLDLLRDPSASNVLGLKAREWVIMNHSVAIVNAKLLQIYAS